MRAESERERVEPPPHSSAALLLRLSRIHGEEAAAGPPHPRMPAAAEAGEKRASPRAATEETRLRLGMVGGGWMVERRKMRVSVCFFFSLSNMRLVLWLVTSFQCSTSPSIGTKTALPLSFSLELFRLSILCPEF